MLLVQPAGRLRPSRSPRSLTRLPSGRRRAQWYCSIGPLGTSRGSPGTGRKEPGSEGFEPRRTTTTAPFSVGRERRPDSVAEPDGGRAVGSLGGKRSTGRRRLRLPRSRRSFEPSAETLRGRSSWSSHVRDRVPAESPGPADEDAGDRAFPRHEDAPGVGDVEEPEAPGGSGDGPHPAREVDREERTCSLLSRRPRTRSRARPESRRFPVSTRGRWASGAAAPPRRA